MAPVRTCVGCRRRDEQSAMLRVARGAAGLVVSRTAAGRGAWVHPGCGQVALRRKAFPRALRGDVGDPTMAAAVASEVDAHAPGGNTLGQSRA